MNKIKKLDGDRLVLLRKLHQIYSSGVHYPQPVDSLAKELELSKVAIRNAIYYLEGRGCVKVLASNSFVSITSDGIDAFEDFVIRTKGNRKVKRFMMNGQDREPAQIFNTTVHGNANVANASSNFTQSIAEEVKKGDLDSLLAYFKSKNVDEEDLNSLVAAIETDPTPTTPDLLGARSQSWVERMIYKATTGKWDVPGNIAGNVLATLLTKAIFLYHGIDVIPLP